MARIKVFVSYSRHDENLVKPLAGLLGVATDDAVFLDLASIKPGDRWKDKIDSALRNATVLIVCWCCEAQKSEFVAYEIAAALQDSGKKLVPVLFCDTPLPKSLSAFQWIDLRAQVRHVCTTVPPSPAFEGAPVPVQPTALSKLNASKPINWRVPSVIALGGLMILGSAALLFHSHVQPPATYAQRSERKWVPSARFPKPDHSVAKGQSLPEARTPESPPSTIRSSQKAVPIGWLIVAIVFLLTMCFLVWRWSTINARRRRTEKVFAAATAYFRNLRKPA